MAGGGLRRGRAIALVVFGASPGSLSLQRRRAARLPDVDLPDEALQDPSGSALDYRARGRDGGARCRCRGTATSPPFGFSANPDTWLPLPREWAALTVREAARRNRLDAVVLSPRNRIASQPKRVRRRCHPVAGLARRRAGVPVGWRAGVCAQRGAPPDGVARRRTAVGQRRVGRRHAPAEHRCLAGLVLARADAKVPFSHRN